MLLARYIFGLLGLVAIGTLSDAEANDRYDILGVKPGMELADAIRVIETSSGFEEFGTGYLDSRSFLTPILSQGYPKACYPIIGALRDAAVFTLDDQMVSLFFDKLDKRQRVHTVIRVLDLDRVGISPDNVLLALEDKYGTGKESPMATHAWGKCIPPDISLYHTPRESKSMALSPDEIQRSRAIRACTGAMGRSNGNRFYSFYFQHGNASSDVVVGWNDARIFQNGEEVNPESGTLRQSAIEMVFPERGFFDLSDCGQIAYVHFFEQTYPARSQKAFILVSDSDELIRNSRAGVREALSEQQENPGSGKVKF